MSAWCASAGSNSPGRVITSSIAATIGVRPRHAGTQIAFETCLFAACAKSGCLQRQSFLAGHVQSPPDRWRNAEQDDPRLVERGAGFSSGGLDDGNHSIHRD